MIDLPPLDPAIEIVIATRGMSKGLAQTNGPQIVGRAQVAAGDYSIGGQYKNVTSSGADGEWSAFAGFGAKARGFNLRAAIAYKILVGADAREDSDAVEISASAARPLGPVAARISLVYSPDDLGGTRSSLYAELGASWEPAKGTAVSANAGRRTRGGGPDYISFNGGLTQTLSGNFTADFRYYDTGESELGTAYRGRFVASLSTKF